MKWNSLSSLSTDYDTANDIMRKGRQCLHCAIHVKTNPMCTQGISVTDRHHLLIPVFSEADAGGMRWLVLIGHGLCPKWHPVPRAHGALIKSSALM